MCGSVPVWWTQSPTNVPFRNSWAAYVEELLALSSRASKLVKQKYWLVQAADKWD